MAPLRVYVGTDEWQRDAGAERVLEHSIRKHATCDVAITWMRSGDPGWEVSEHGDASTWKINVPPGSAWKKRGAWGTPFSAFRFAIPEACEFAGRAVYLDADMLVRADMAEFLTMDTDAGYRCISKARTDVALIDCSWFADKAWWPRIEQMKASGWITYYYCQLLLQHGGIAPTLDPLWNVCDPMRPCADAAGDAAKLRHFTTVPIQPYKPYPTVKYFKHPWRHWVEEWNQHNAEALAASR